MQSHGLQPSRLLCPWDSPGKNTGAGCHFLLQRIFPTQGLNPGLLLCRHSLPTELSGKPPAHTHGSVSFSVMSLCDTMECSLGPWDSPGKNNAVGCHSLLQGIFPIQGLNLGLLHFVQILYHLSHHKSSLIFLPLPFLQVAKKILSLSLNFSNLTKLCPGICC